MKKFLVMVIFMFSLMNFACAAEEPAIDPPPPPTLTESVDAFCWKYFATLNHNENIFYSPYGINAALSILVNGATGDTRKEILDVLEIGNVDSFNADHKNFSELIEKNYRGENLFNEANLLLIDKSIIGRGINKNFQRMVNQSYKSDVREANFSGDIDVEREKISAWVNEKTAGFIPDYKSIATKATLTDLLNVVYFKGAWMMPFKPSHTERRTFTNSDAAKVKVDMMWKVFENSVVYREDDKFKGIVLSYTDNAAMYLILPVDNNALNVAELWNNESPSYRENFIDELGKSFAFRGEVVVRLPKFELDIENSLVENFKAMGINRAFSDNAEFFNIIKDTSLKIGDAKHRAKVKVDEQGTEAAAVTEVVMLEATAIPNAPLPKTVYFIAERPFLFMIRDINTNVTLFAGVANKF